jgi:FAD/FMN-containing dehydrogenase
MRVAARGDPARGILRKKGSAAGPARIRGHRLASRKDTSNLFRDREPSRERHLDMRHFDQVLEVSPKQGWINAEGMATYATLTDATVARGVMPAVVPQLKSITIGGAAAGVGIEATSFRWGLVHETLKKKYDPNGRFPDLYEKCVLRR